MGKFYWHHPESWALYQIILPLQPISYKVLKLFHFGQKKREMVLSIISFADSLGAIYSLGFLPSDDPGIFHQLTH